MDAEELVYPLLREADEEGTDPAPAHSSGPWQAVATLFNLYCGIGLLSMAYAVRLGGWLALLTLGAAAAASLCAGLLICKAFEHLPPGTHKTFPELGGAAGGRWGRRVATSAALAECFGGACIALLVMWEHLVLVLPDAGALGLTPVQLAAAATCVGLLPTATISSFRRLSPLSAMGLAASAVVMATVLALPALDPHRQHLKQPPPGHEVLAPGALQATGIFAVCLSGHSALPSLRSSLRQPSAFPGVLAAAFAALLAVYATVGGVGYWYFGEAASPLITTDLALCTRVFGGARLDLLLSLLIVVNLFSKYPALVMVMADMLASLLLQPPGAEGAAGPAPALRPSGRTVLRGGIMAASFALSWAARGVLGSVVSLVGGLCSIACSLVIPTGAYVLLSWRQQRGAARAGLLLMVGGGAALAVSVTAANLRAVTQGGLAAG